MNHPWRLHLSVAVLTLTLVVWIGWLNWRLTDVENNRVQICEELAIVAKASPVWERITVCNQLGVDPDDTFPQSDESQ